MYKFHPEKKATIVTAPFSGGQPKGGVELGPQYMLEAGFQKQLSALGWDTEVAEPLKDSSFEERKTNDRDEYGVKNAAIVLEMAKTLHELVYQTLQLGRMPVTIGGDHSLGIATVSAALRHNPDTCVLWIDAHADINSPATTDTGNLHGCPISFVMGIDRELYPPEFAWVPEVLKLNRIAYIGLRDVDEGEKAILRKYNIPAFSMYHIDKYGIGKVLDMALDAVNPTRESPVHLSYDIDAIDPTFVAATGTRVEGGLYLREGLFIAEDIAALGLLSSLDIVELNPLLAKNPSELNDTVSVACAIGRCALGQSLL